MSQLLAPSRIGRCSAASRSYLLGPDGPAGPPPGHRLRSGGYMAATRSGTKGKISRLDVSTLSGEPRLPDLRAAVRLAGPAAARRAGLFVEDDVAARQADVALMAAGRALV